MNPYLTPEANRLNEVFGVEILVPQIGRTVILNETEVVVPDVSPEDLMILQQAALGMTVEQIAEYNFTHNPGMSALAGRLGIPGRAGGMVRHSYRLGLLRTAIRKNSRDWPTGNLGPSESVEFEYASTGYTAQESKVLRGLSIKTIGRLRRNILESMNAPSQNMAVTVGYFIEHFTDIPGWVREPSPGKE